MEASAVSSPDRPGPLPVRSRSFLPTRQRLLTLWPACVATALFLGLIGRQIVQIKAQEGGRYVYTLDDTYAHLAIARNFWQHGMWTFNSANGFESGSSSLLWPVLISLCFAVFGVHEYFPLVLNILAVVGLLFYAGEAIRRLTGSTLLGLLILCAVVVLTPLPAVVSTGMEHSLQILLSLAFVDLAARLLMDGSAAATTRRTPWWLCLIGCLLVLTRYEGLFLVAAVGLLLLCRRRWVLAVTLGVVTATPLTIFGLISVSKGWAFLPDSLLLKGNTQVGHTLAGVLDYLSFGYHQMAPQPHVVMMVAGAAAALLGSLQRRWSLWTYPALVLLITLIALAQHLQFASLGWFYRYEAYLVTLVLFGVGVALAGTLPEVGWRYWWRPAGLVHATVLGVAALLFGMPLWERARESYPRIVAASYNIYEQQYQMARFVRRFYNGRGVIANDVGAISFLGDKVRLLDTVGLSNIATLRARRDLSFNHDKMRRFERQHGSEIAVIYDSWAYMFGGPLPEWVRLGQWTIPHNTICAAATVSIYATSPAQAPRLLHALQEFGASLPPDIQQDGVYCGGNSLDAVGTFGQEGPRDAVFFWTAHAAQFDLYPASDTLVGADTASLRLSVLPITPGQTISVYFNDRLVGTKELPAVGPLNWTAFTVPVQWRSGTNVLKLTGVGQTLRPPGDTRDLLFAVLDPRRMANDAGAVVAQSAVAQPAAKPARP